MNTAELNGGGVNTRHDSTGMMRSSEGLSRKGRGKSVCQRRGYQVDQSRGRSGMVERRG